MDIWSKFKRWLDEREDRRRLHQSASFWHRAGALSPYSAAVHERSLRFRLEEFRNFASRRYLEDSTLTLDDIKQEWLDDNVKPMAKIDLLREDAKSLKAAIAAMPGHEVFVGLAAKRRKEYIDKAIADAKTQATAMARAQRERALRM